MPDLDELRRNLLNALPSFMAAGHDDLGGYVPGQAQTRLSHANAFVLPQDQYNQAVKDFGVGGEEAMTLSAQPNALDKVLNFLGMSSSPIMRSASAGPTVVIPQPKNAIDPQWSNNMTHEAIHALLNGADTKMNTIDVENLVPAQALVQLSRYYNPQETAQEIPARALTDPTSLALKRTPESDPTNEAGKHVMRQYATMLEMKGFKQQADKLRQYFNLSGTPQGIRDDTQSFQKPNEVF